MGRMDTVRKACPTCNGSRKDPKKRSRQCSACMGSGTADYCTNCGEAMPCKGSLSDVMDQSYCALDTELKDMVAPTVDTSAAPKDPVLHGMDYYDFPTRGCDEES